VLRGVGLEVLLLVDRVVGLLGLLGGMAHGLHQPNLLGDPALDGLERRGLALHGGQLALVGLVGAADLLGRHVDLAEVALGGEGEHLHLHPGRDAEIVLAVCVVLLELLAGGAHLAAAGPGGQLEELHVDALGLQAVDVLHLLLGDLHALAEDVLDLGRLDGPLLQRLEVLGAHSLVAQQLLVALGVEDAVALEGGLHRDDGADFLVAHPDAHLLGLHHEDRLVDEVVQGLLLEIEALDEVFGEVGAEPLAVHVQQVLVLLAVVAEGDDLVPHRHEGLGALVPARGAEVEDEDDDDEAQQHLDEPALGVLAHELKHGVSLGCRVKGKSLL